MATAMKPAAPRVTSETVNKHGATVYVVTSRAHFGEQLWLVSGGVCGCQGFRYRGRCSHLEAVTIHEATKAALDAMIPRVPVLTPKRRTSLGSASAILQRRAFTGVFK